MVKYDHKLENISYNSSNIIIGEFANGARATGTLLIGAHGPHSIVRNLFFGRKKASTTPLGSVYVNIAFRYPEAEKARFVRSSTQPVFCVAMHSEPIMFMAMQDVPDPENPETWFFQLGINWCGERAHESEDNATKLNEIK